MKTHNAETVHMADMTWDQYARRVQEGRPIILPVGAIEQHGYHLPLRTDTLMAEFFATRIARKVDAIVAPAISYGYKSQPATGGGQDFPGTSSVDGATLIAMIRDLLREFFRHGCRKVAIIDAHSENRMFVTEGIDLALRDLLSADAKVLLLKWTPCLTDADLEEFFPGGFVGWPREHAGVMETSFMMYAYPELVLQDRIGEDQAERIIPYEIFPPPPSVYPRSGLLTDARPASPAIGERLVAIVEDRLVAIMTEEFSL